MRISDRSSDVGSSDLTWQPLYRPTDHEPKEAKPNGLFPERGPRCIAPAAMMQSRSRKQAWKGKPIVLVGLMGVGKSTVGKRLATRLRLPFVDADTENETAAGMRSEVQTSELQSRMRISDAVICLNKRKKVN